MTNKYQQFPTFINCVVKWKQPPRFQITELLQLYEDWNFNSGNYLFTTDTK